MDVQYFGFWLQRFRSGILDRTKQFRESPETKVDNVELKAIVEADAMRPMSELAAGCGVSKKTILIH